MNGQKLKATARHCLDTDNELEALRAQAAGTKDPVKAGSRCEILGLVHQLEAKIGAFRTTDNDDKFLDKIDRSLRELLNSIDTTEKPQPSGSTRSLRFR